MQETIVGLSYHRTSVYADTTNFQSSPNRVAGEHALYKDPAGLNTYEKNLSAITVKWNEGASKEEKQERIITQKWIANWPLGNEAWADYRRTGYPKLLPATSEGNLSGGIVDSEKGARRMPYPSEEYTSNTENVQEAVNSYLGGPDNMATDVWWARK